jgi:hypothetical protein
VSLSDAFFVELAALAARHQTDPLVFLDVWNSESGLNPRAENAASHAQGLNQMMPSTLKGLGAPANFKDLAGEQQLPWIERLITSGEKLNGGPFRSAARYYHSNFFPRTLPRGQTPDTVVVGGDATDPVERSAYAANKGMDHTGKGRITYADLTAFLNLAKNSNRVVYEAARARLPSGSSPRATPPAAVSTRANSSRGAFVRTGVGMLITALAVWRTK